MDYYQLLGVSRQATPAEIQKAYRQKMKAVHPDVVGGEDEHAKALNQAYSVLGDAGKRAVYDARLQAATPPSKPRQFYGEYPSRAGIVIQDEPPPQKLTDHDFAPPVISSVRWAIIAFLVALMLTALLSYAALANQQDNLPFVPTPTPYSLEEYSNR